MNLNKIRVWKAKKTKKKINRTIVIKRTSGVNSVSMFASLVKSQIKSAKIYGLKRTITRRQSSTKKLRLDKARQFQ